MVHGHGVLVVDDDGAIRTMMAAWLEAEGYEVRTAGNGLEALRVLQRDAPSIMVVDLNMPVMDGAELRRRQLADPTIADIPFILVSGAHNAERMALELGIGDVVLKPYKPEELL